MSDETRINLEAALAEMEANFATTDAIGAKWLPPLGKYVANIISVKDGTFKVGSSNVPYFAVQAKLMGGDLDGKDFQLGYFKLAGGEDKAAKTARGFLKGFANLIAGRETTSWADASAVIIGCVGAVVEVDVYASENKKNPAKPYTNVRATALVE
jgi:hypothetical protein